MKVTIHTTFDRMVLGTNDSYLGFYVVDGTESTFISSSTFKNSAIIKALHTGDSIVITGTIKTRKVWVPLVESTPYHTGDGTNYNANIISYLTNYLVVESVVKSNAKGK